MKLLPGLVLVAAMAGVAAAEPEHEMMGHGMMGTGMGGHQGPGQMCHIVGSGHHNDGALAFLKAELKITAGQGAAWDAFAVAFRDAKPNAHGGKGHDGKGHEGRKMERKGPASLTERMAHHEMMMEMHLAQMKKMHGVMGNLYSALNADQKRMADELLPAFMMCRMRG